MNNDPYTMDMFNEPPKRPKRVIRNYGSKPLERGTDPSTSRTAHKYLDTNKVEQEVCWAIGHFPQGCIYDDVVNLLPHRRVHSIQPRFAPLLRKGFIVATGEFRKGRAGRYQRVVKLNEEQT
jgi:hypothetical protein